jgi:hypothetical protein
MRIETETMGTWDDGTPIEGGTPTEEVQDLFAGEDDLLSEEPPHLVNAPLARTGTER